MKLNDLLNLYVQFGNNAYYYIPSGEIVRLYGSALCAVEHYYVPSGNVHVNRSALCTVKYSYVPSGHSVSSDLLSGNWWLQQTVNTGSITIDSTLPPPGDTNSFKWQGHSDAKTNGIIVYSDPIDVIPGINYNIIYWSKTNGVQGVTGASTFPVTAMFVHVLWNANNIVGGPFYVNTVFGAGGSINWGQYSFSITIPAGVTQILLGFSDSNGFLAHDIPASYYWLGSIQLYANVGNVHVNGMAEYTYIVLANGTIYVKGEPEYYLTKDTWEFIASGKINVVAQYLIHYTYDVHGGFLISGSSLLDFNYIANIIINVSGYALLECDFIYLAYVEINLGWFALCQCLYGFIYIADGIMHIGGYSDCNHYSEYYEITVTAFINISGVVYLKYKQNPRVFPSLPADSSTVVLPTITIGFRCCLPLGPCPVWPMKLVYPDYYQEAALAGITPAYVTGITQCLRAQVKL